MNTEEKIKFIVESVKFLFDKDISIIDDNTKLSNLGLDSLDVVELVLYYEEQTGNRIEDDRTPILFSDLLRAME